jgi:hypothetical protein
MRWLYILSVIFIAAGCRSQSAPLSNPFLAPNRVPPPSTGTLAPGTAQPYYAGGAVPGMTSAATAPPSVAPLMNSTMPQTQALPASTGLPGAPVPSPTYSPQTAPVTPPGGWSQPPAAAPYGVQPTSGYSPVTPTPADNTAVRIAPDDQNLRFGTPTNSSSFVQAAASQFPATNTPYVYTPPTTGPTTNSIVQPAQFTTPVTPGVASDGFRPQGSSQLNPSNTAAQPAPAVNSNQPYEDPQHFSHDPSYTTLRGQLQYYPQTEHWGLRYISHQGTPDAYGGVAVIANPDVLVGVQPGEHLVVQGFLETLDNGDGTFVPAYTVEGIQRQR